MDSPLAPKGVDRRSSGGRARGRDSRAASEHRPERGVENLDAEIDLLLADRERRRHTEAVRARPCAHDVHGEAAAQALLGHRGAERVRRAAALALLDELEPDEEPRGRACPTRPSSSITSSTASPAAAGRGSETCEVTWRKPFLTQSSSIAPDVIVAASGNPPRSVFETATRSGTTPSCSNPNIIPSRPKPVWASSRTSSIPLSSQSSRARPK